MNWDVFIADKQAIEQYQLYDLSEPKWWFFLYILGRQDTLRNHPIALKLNIIFFGAMISRSKRNMDRFFFEYYEAHVCLMLHIHMSNAYWRKSTTNTNALFCWYMLINEWTRSALSDIPWPISPIHINSTHRLLTTTNHAVVYYNLHVITNYSVKYELSRQRKEYKTIVQLQYAISKSIRLVWRTFWREVVTTSIASIVYNATVDMLYRLFTIEQKAYNKIQIQKSIN